MTLKEYADKIVEVLSKKGFVIHRYDAYSTSSVYLKLDYGVCNTIRISDHEGKQHLQYRYNLIIGGENNIVEERYIRYYFNENSVKDMLMQILFDKQSKMQRYGKQAYRNFMLKNMNDHKNDNGFWASAKLVATSTDMSPGQLNGYRATRTFIDEDSMIQDISEIEDGVYAMGPKVAIDTLKQTFANQHRLDAKARFHPGDRVRVIATHTQLRAFFRAHKETKLQAETHALQLLGKPEYSVGVNLGAMECDEGRFYTVEFPLIPMECLPESFLSKA